MSNTLVVPGDLDIFPGAPFSEDLVDIAVATLRADAGWHIAPVLTETLTVESNGGSLLILPTRRIVSIAAIRDVTTGSETLTGWSRAGGGLYRTYGGFPSGLLEVDLTHGFDATPADLLPVIADYARRASDPRDPMVQSESTTRGPFSESKSYRSGTTTLAPSVARYAVAAGVA